MPNIPLSGDTAQKQTLQLSIALFSGYHNPLSTGKANFLELISCSGPFEKYRDKIAKARLLDKSKPEEKAQLAAIKSSLPCFTPSVSAFKKNRRSSANAEQLTRYFSVDIDGLGHERAKEVRDKLAAEKCTLAVQCSISGTGVVSYFIAETLKNFEDHRRFLVDALGRIAIRRLPGDPEGFTCADDEMISLAAFIDSASCDIARLRVLTHDPDTYFNPDAERIWGKLEKKRNTAIRGSAPKNLKGALKNLAHAWKRAKSKEEIRWRDGQRHHTILKWGAQANHLGVPFEEAKKFFEAKIELYNFPDHSRTLKNIYTKYGDQAGIFAQPIFERFEANETLQVERYLGTREIDRLAKLLKEKISVQLQAPTGCGKTEAALVGKKSLAQRYLDEGGRVLYFVSTLALQRQLREALRRNGQFPLLLNGQTEDVEWNYLPSAQLVLTTPDQIDKLKELPEGHFALEMADEAHNLAWASQYRKSYEALAERLKRRKEAGGHTLLISATPAYELNELWGVHTLRIEQKDKETKYHAWVGQTKEDIIRCAAERFQANYNLKKGKAFIAINCKAAIDQAILEIKKRCPEAHIAPIYRLPSGEISDPETVSYIEKHQCLPPGIDAIATTELLFEGISLKDDITGLIIAETAIGERRLLFHQIEQAAARARTFTGVVDLITPSFKGGMPVESFEKRMKSAEQLAEAVNGHLELRPSTKEQIHTRKLLEQFSGIEWREKAYRASETSCMRDFMKAKQTSLDDRAWLQAFAASGNNTIVDETIIAPMSQSERKAMQEQQEAVDAEQTAKTEEMAKKDLGLLCLSLARNAKDKAQRAILNRFASVGVEAKKVQAFAQEARSALVNCRAMRALRFYLLCLLDFQGTETLRTFCFSASKGERRQVKQAVQVICLRHGSLRHGFDAIEAASLKKLDALVEEKKGQMLSSEEIVEMMNASREGWGLPKLNHQTTINRLRLIYDHQCVRRLNAQDVRETRYILIGQRDLRQWLSDKGLHLKNPPGEALGVHRPQV